MYFYVILLILILIDLYRKSYIKCRFVVVLRKWHLFVQKKKIDFFKIQKMDFAKKSRFKPIKSYINGILTIKLA